MYNADRRPTGEDRVNWEAAMKMRLLAALLLASTLAARTAAAQPFPFNEAGVTNGHWHLNSKDVAAWSSIMFRARFRSPPELTYNARAVVRTL